MKTGDKVRFLNAVGEGIVKGFKNKDIVWVEEEDGFKTPVLIKECIVIEPDKTPMEEEIIQKIKDDSPRRQPARVMKEKTPSIIEVDLHINQLLDSTAGMNNTEIITVQLNKFRQTLGENKNKIGQKIVFIHGKGEGVLRNAILSELKSKYKDFSVQDASFREYGFGATMVTVRQIKTNRQYD